MADERRKPGAPGAKTPGPTAGPTAPPPVAPNPFGDDGAWDDDLAAWDAAIPVVPPARGGRAPTGPASGSGAPAGAETAFDDLSAPGVVRDMDDLPDLIPSGAFDVGAPPESGSYAALITTDESAPGPFDGEPPPEAPPPFPSRLLPEMTAERWGGGLAGLITSGDGTPAMPAADYLSELTAVLAEERAHVPAADAGGPARAVTLALAAARVAELADQPDQARAHLDAAVAQDGTLVAAHRARWLLAERIGQVDDDGAAESLSRLALMAHADQAYYRALRAEWVLTRASRGTIDAAAPALITAAPEGLGRLLAEAELSWRQPAAAATAATVLETAAHRVGDGLGAALLACAAQLNEAGGNFRAATEQRFVAARMDTAHAPAAMGMVRDIARLEPVAAVPALEVLMAHLPPSPLKVGLARWGAHAARRTGEATRAWKFVEDVARLAPANLDRGTSALLARERLDAWLGRPSGAGGASSFAAVAAAVAAAWPSAAVRACLALHAAARVTADDDAAAFLRLVDTLVAEGAATAALAPALETVAWDSPTAAHRRRALQLVRELDPARWVAASLDLVDALSAAPRPQPDDDPGLGPAAGESVETVLHELAERDVGGPAFWRVAARQAARGDRGAAAATLVRGCEATPWQHSRLAAPLGELAAELLADVDLTAAADRLEASLAPSGPPAHAASLDHARIATLARLLRRLRDRERWAAFVAGQSAAGLVSEDRRAHARGRRAELLLEPVFWPHEGGGGDDVFSLAAAALRLVPRHPVALALTVNAQPDPAALADQFVAAASGAELQAAAFLAAAVATLQAGDGARALELARHSLSAARGRAGVLNGEVALGAAALVRRLLWAATGQPARAQILSELVGGQDDDAPRLVEAAEGAERAGLAGTGPALYARARQLPGAALVAADIAGGEQRLGTMPPDARAAGGAVAAAAPSRRATGPRRDDARLARLEEAARAGRWSDVVRRLVTAPPHEQAAGPSTLALAAALDEAHGDGADAPGLWSSARARFLSAAASSPAGPGEPDALFRAEIGVTVASDAEAGAVLQRLATVATSMPGRTPGGEVSTADRRSSSLFLVEASSRAATGADLERHLRTAVARDPASAPAALAWRRWLARAGRVDEAAAAGAAEAEALVDPELRVQALLRAAGLLGATSASDSGSAVPMAIDADGMDSLDGGSDPTHASASPPGSRIDRAAAYLTRALEIAPHDHDAFSRLRTLYEEAGRDDALAELLGRRLAVTSNPFEATALRLARTELFAGPLGDVARARAELEAVLQKEPHHARALGRLAELEQQHGNQAAAAELLIRQAFIERSPAKLRDLFLRLGRIYTRHVPDAKRAIGAYSRVLQLDGGNQEALEELSRLYLGLGENKNAVATTERLVQLEAVPARRSAYHIRLGHLADRGGDVRTAGQHFRKAVDEAPRDIEALGELVRHLDKVRDVAGRRQLLDRVASDLRKGVLAAPADPVLLAGLIAVSRWRGRTATAAAVAELRALTDPTDDRLPDWASPPPQGRRLAALATPAVDEQTFTFGGISVPPAVRHLFRLLGPALREGGRADLARLGVERAHRIAPGRPPRDLVDPIAADLAAGPYELYVPAARPASETQPLLVEPGKPPTVVLGGALVRLGPHAVMFMAGRTMRLLATHLDVALTGGPAELGAWLTGIIRQFMPEYRHPDVPVEAGAARAVRVAKLFPRKSRQEVLPYAMESSGPQDLVALHAGIRDAMNRVGLLACGSLGAALRVLLGAAGAGLDGRLSTAAIKRDAQAMALLSFALSDEHDELVRALD